MQSKSLPGCWCVTWVWRRKSTRPGGGARPHSAGLVQASPWIGPSQVSAGVQTLTTHTHTHPSPVGSEEQTHPCGGLRPTAALRSLRPGLFKPLHCYLNASSLVTASSLSRGRVCAPQVSSLPWWGPVQWLGLPEASAAAPCTSSWFYRGSCWAWANS